MPKGGARARSGPAPDLTALRRDRDGAAWTVLPGGGRQGEAPAWPLSRQTNRERVLWARYWRMPQALVWERNHAEDEVALHIRTLAAAEKPSASATIRALVLRQQGSLLLTADALARARYVIEGEAPAIERLAHRFTEAPSEEEDGEDDAPAPKTTGGQVVDWAREKARMLQ